MSDLPRLNGIIRAWEQGRPAFSCFASTDRRTAMELSTSPLDSLVFEMEHSPWDAMGLQDAMQYLLNRKQIAANGLVPQVTPLCRIPANGSELDQQFAKQALDRGCYGVVWPHVNTIEEAYNAVASMRYSRPRNAALYEPAGRRGDGPASAVRYWGVTQPEYYERADVWPLKPQGELLCFIQIESSRAVENLDDILSNVPGIACLLIGEGDLSQDLGYPRQYEHPEVLGAMAKVLEVARKHGVRVGHPHVTGANVQRVIDEGYGFLMSMPARSFAVLEKGREIVAAAVPDTSA